MNTNNRSLLFENNIIYDTLYICLLDNVIKYSKNKNLEDNITLKLYYPLIEDSNYDEFLKKTKNKQQLYSVYEKIYKEFVKSEKELNLSKHTLTQDLTYITLPREQTPLTTLLDSNFVDLSIKKYIKEEGIFYLTYKFNYKFLYIYIYKYIILKYHSCILKYI